MLLSDIDRLVDYVIAILFPEIVSCLRWKVPPSYVPYGYEWNNNWSNGRHVSWPGGKEGSSQDL